MNSEKGRQLHSLAEQAREKGDFLEALKTIEEAAIKYAEDKDYIGFSEIQGSRFLTLRHLFEQTNDINFMILAKYAAEAAVSIAKASNQEHSLTMPLFNLAKSQETLGEISEAALTYKDAIENHIKFPGEFHNRPAVISDMKVHLSVCEYKAGDSTAFERAIQAIHELESDTQETQYNKDVWTSGAYMKMAEILLKDKPEDAKNYLQKAKQIIDSNTKLVLRKKQWEKLSTSFS